MDRVRWGEGGDGSPFWVCDEWRGRGLVRGRGLKGGVGQKGWGSEGGVIRVGSRGWVGVGVDGYFG